MYNPYQPHDDKDIPTQRLQERKDQETTEAMALEIIEEDPDAAYAFMNDFLQGQLASIQNLKTVHPLALLRSHALWLGWHTLHRLYHEVGEGDGQDGGAKVG